ncbi:Cell pattern formation-associated protein, partial [Lachnellula willkommii]
LRTLGDPSPKILCSLSHTHEVFVEFTNSLSLSDLTIPTEKLDLPSISQVQTRGPSDIPYYNHHAAQRPLYVNDRLPSLSLPQPQQAYSSGTSSPRVGSISSLGSSSILNGSSHSSYTTASSNGPKTPSPTLPTSSGLPPSLSQTTYNTSSPSGPAYSYNQDPYPNMNHGQQEMYYPSHISTGQPPPPQTVTSSGMGHYPQHQQPQLLQPSPAQYSPAPGPYNQYGYSNGLTSPQSAGHSVPGSMGQGSVLPLPAMSAGQPGLPGPGYAAQQGFDTTGQIAPPGMKPRVTATLWEDEGSLCFQVEAKGVCVARREDNHMINGTKLLNVAGMTRGRRDGILKSEKMRHVVKIGPMHLKGVWIPFERALDFANKEKITELLYPLFVHNIGALLYHPTNQTRTNAVMAAAERRKQEQNQMRNSQAPGLPSLHQHHHHSMNNSIGNHLPGPQHSLAPHPSTVGRPSIDRAHTFPTPPTSASSVMGNMGSSDGNFQWSQGGMGGAQGTNPLSIDTGLSNARSMPTTPATTPPGTSIQSMQQYQQGSQPYDASRQMYSAPPSQQNVYPQPTTGQQEMPRYPQPNSYNIKNEMGPPLARAPGSEAEHHETKGANGLLHPQGHGQVDHGQGEEEADHEHDAEYTHDNSAGYDASRGPYSYTNGPAVGSMPGEHPHLSPEMTGSPNHPASGRATPRTATAPQPYYAQQQGGYNTPPRAPQPPSSNLYNVISSERGTANGNTTADVYGSQSDLGNSIPNGYATQQTVMNGAPPSNKRGRDDDDDVRPSSRGPAGDLDLKRRKTVREGSVSGPTYDPSLNRNRSAITQRRR